MDKIGIDKLEEILKQISSDKMLRRAFRLLIPKKNEWVRYVTSIILSGVLAVTLAFVPKTVTYTKNVTDVLQAVILAIFAILFTGYALFQALLGKRMLKSLIKTQNGEQICKVSKLQELNESFTDGMMLDIFCLILNVIILIILPVVPEDWVLIPDNLILNEIIAAILIALYLYGVNYMNDELQRVFQMLEKLKKQFDNAIPAAAKGIVESPEMQTIMEISQKAQQTIPMALLRLSELTTPYIELTRQFVEKITPSLLQLAKASARLSVIDRIGKVQYVSWSIVVPSFYGSKDAIIKNRKYLRRGGPRPYDQPKL